MIHNNFPVRLVYAAYSNEGLRPVHMQGGWEATKKLLCATWNDWLNCET